MSEANTIKLQEYRLEINGLKNVLEHIRRSL